MVSTAPATVPGALNSRASLKSKKAPQLHQEDLLDSMGFSPTSQGGNADVPLAPASLLTAKQVLGRGAAAAVSLALIEVDRACSATPGQSLIAERCDAGRDVLR